MIKRSMAFYISAAYMVLVLPALIFLVFMLIFHTDKSEFAGVYLVILALPWSIFLTIALDFLHIQDSLPIAIKMLILIFFTFVNAFIIYFVGTKMEESNKGKIRRT